MSQRELLHNEIPSMFDRIGRSGLDSLQSRFGHATDGHRDHENRDRHGDFGRRDYSVGHQRATKHAIVDAQVGNFLEKNFLKCGRVEKCLRAAHEIPTALVSFLIGRGSQDKSHGKHNATVNCSSGNGTRRAFYESSLVFLHGINFESRNNTIPLHSVRAG